MLMMMMMIIIIMMTMMMIYDDDDDDDDADDDDDQISKFLETVWKDCKVSCKGAKFLLFTMCISTVLSCLKD